ncbi:ATP-binding protein [Patescibacteria group bacterium]|nr:ATP-binding protein [Patescibacteria group bacterium]
MAYFRQIFSNLIEQKDKKQIVFLLGARQVGKTTLLKMLQKKLGKENPSLYLDLDLTKNLELFSSLENLIDYLRNNGYKKNSKRFYLFLDEVQRYNEATMILKNLHDHYPNIKIYASGSSTLEIKNKIKDSLAGRKFIFHIYPLDFKEFLIFSARGGKDKLKLFVKQGFDNDIVQKYIREFLLFGGYPAVVLAKTNNEKKRVLESIFDLFLKKDILEFLHIDNLSAIKKILSLLSANNGQITNYSQLAKETGIDTRTLKNYLEILQETFLIFSLKPYFINKHKEVVKADKIYFYDTGARNYFLNNFAQIDLRNDSGFLFENMIIEEFIKNRDILDDFRFWRNKNKQEVDLIKIKDSKLMPIEIKYKKFNKQKDYKNLLSFMKEYKIDIGYLLNLKLNNEKLIPGTRDKKIIFINNFDLAF